MRYDRDDMRRLESLERDVKPVRHWGGRVRDGGEMP
jgi:hypothetical protein